MTEISLWQLALEPQGQLLDPERLATNLFINSRHMFHELTKEERMLFSSAVLNALNHEKHRYRLWCSDFDAGEGGLDDILVGTNHIKETLLAVLRRMADALVVLVNQTSLAEELDGICEQVETLNIQVSQIIDNQTFQHDAEHDAYPNINIDDFSSSESEGSSQEELSQIDEALFNIELSNNLLCDLGPALYDSAQRAAGKRDRNAELDNYKQQTMLQAGAGPYIANILEIFPSIDVEFARRLGEANRDRYNRLQRARDEATTRFDESETQSADEEIDFHRQLHTDQRTAVTSQATSEFTAPTTKFSSIFDAPQEPRPSKRPVTPRVPASVTSFASSVGDGGDTARRGIPKFPNDNEGSPFDCTICGARLSILKDEWTKHVYGDLQPYICTFTDCGYGIESFSSRRQWGIHEFSEHRKMPMWTCGICKSNQTTEIGITRHVAEQHEDLNDQELESMAESRSRHLGHWIHEQECPFCRTPLAGGTTRRQYISHVGRHLQQVSHAAIPMSAMLHGQANLGDEFETRPMSVSSLESLASAGDDHSEPLAATGNQYAKHNESVMSTTESDEDPDLLSNLSEFHRSVSRNRTPETCQWVLDSFNEWRRNSKGLLWLQGSYGSGKTYSCSRVIDALNEDTEVMTLYYYFSNGSMAQQENSSFVRSLLLQALKKRPPRSQGHWQTYYHQHRAIEESLSVEEVLKILQKIIREFEQVCIVVDAVDLTVNQLETVLILDTLSPVASILATSRSFVAQWPNEPIRVRTIHFDQPTVEQDILLFLSDSFRNDSRLKKWKSELQTEVIQALTSGAKGMFKWVDYKLKELRQQVNARSVKKALHDQPSALNREYRQMLLDLESVHTLAVKKMLQWLCFCNRSMTLEELNEVLAVDVDQNPPCYDPDLRLHSVWDGMDICSPLLSCIAMGDSKTYYVTLLHPSVKEYLQSEEVRAERQTNLYHVERTTSCGLITKVCLVYLLIWASLDRTTRSSSLLKYAVDEWPEHYRSTKNPKELRILDDLVYGLIRKQELFRAWVRDSASTGAGEHPQPGVASPIYYMSLLGIEGVVKQLLEDGVSPNDPPAGDHGYALEAASQAGHEDVVRLLLEYGAEVNRPDTNQIPPLHIAAKAGHEMVVQLLLDYDAEFERQHGTVGTPLHYAAKWGQREVVEVLLDWGADVNATNAEGLTPLDMALEPVEEVAGEEDKEQLELANARIEKGKVAVAKLLVDRGADIDGSYGSHGSRLMKAAHAGDESAVRILLAAGAHPDVYRYGVPFPHYEPGTPLHEATCHNERLVKMLLDAGANPNFCCASGTPIQWAAGAGSENIVRMLIEAGADVNALTRETDTALQVAIAGGHKDVVRLLLERGADPVWTNRQHSILAGASRQRKRSKSIEQLLLDHGASDTLPSKAELKGHHARYKVYSQKGRQRKRSKSIEQLLLDHGASDTLS